MFRMRAPLSLVAAFLLIALVAAVLIGGRLVQDWNVLHLGSPAGHSQLTPLQQLEARPFTISTYTLRSDCHSGPFNADGDLGAGPVFGYGNPYGTSAWGDYFNNVVYTDSRISGPILIRARDVFYPNQVLFTGQFAAGPTVRTDMYQGTQLVQLHTEVVIDESRTTSTLPSGWFPTAHPHRFQWAFTAVVPQTWSGSTGWQIDGQGFSQKFFGC